MFYQNSTNVLTTLETGDHEDTMMRKAKNIIKLKLEKYPTNFLLQDEDFIDSVFFRFALMDLPLRPGNVHDTHDNRNEHNDKYSQRI